MSYGKQLLDIVAKYRRAKQPWPATKHAIAAWAVQQRLWMPQPSDLIDQCANQLSRAMREEYIRDPQGRTVRAKHAARVEVDGKQMTLWTDIRDADPNLLAVAFQQRRQHIVSECCQLKSDVDSYNENAKPESPFQLVLDFADDVAEAEAAKRNDAA